MTSQPVKVWRFDKKDVYLLQINIFFVYFTAYGAYWAKSSA